MNSIILMGLKHCGKSTAARVISNILSIPAFDTDDVIFELYGKSPREIYSLQGQTSFLEAESCACGELSKRLSSTRADRAVIATGGGICTNEKALLALRGAGVFVFLRADESIIQRRVFSKAKVQDDGSIVNIPAYIKQRNPASLEDAARIFHGFFTERNKLYEEISDITVDVSRGTKGECARRIIKEADGYFARCPSAG